MKDFVKEGFEAIHALPYAGIRPQDYEIAFGNLRLSLVREGSSGETQQSYLTQVSYVASHDEKNVKVGKMLLEPSAQDYHHLLKAIAYNTPSYEAEKENEFFQESEELLADSLKLFFSHLEIKELQTSKEGFVLRPALFPKRAACKASP